MLLPWPVQEVLLPDAPPRRFDVHLNMDTPITTIALRSWDVASSRNSSEGKAWKGQVGIVQQGGMTIDQRCAGLKSNTARGPPRSDGFVGTIGPRDLLFSVDEWPEYRRRLSPVTHTFRTETQIDSLVRSSRIWPRISKASDMRAIPEDTHVEDRPIATLSNSGKEVT